MKKLYVVLDATPVCDKFCGICATSAVHVDPSRYYIIHPDLIRAGHDIPFERKKQIIRCLASPEFNIEIEIGNGNLLISNQGLELIKEASKAFGSEKVIISISGSLLTERKARVISDNVSKVIVSMDVPPGMPDGTRYRNIAEDATRCLDIFRKYSVSVCVSTILKRNNANSYTLERILEHILKHGASEWELLRFYPVGRAFGKNLYEPTLAQYFEVLSFVKCAREMQEIPIKFQHSLSRLLENKQENCQAVTEQIAVRSNGLVVACPWSHDPRGNPLSPFFVLGKLPEMTLEQVLETSVAEFWRKIKDKGPCRLAAFLQHAGNGIPHDIALQKPDPLDAKIREVLSTQLQETIRTGRVKRWM